MKANFWSSAAVNGFLLALITVVYTLFLSAFPLEGKLAAFALGLVKLIATVGVLYYFMKEFGKEHETYSFGDAFSYGLVVSICSNILIACYLVAQYTFIFPDSVDKITESMQKAYKQFNVDQSSVDMILKNLRLVLSLGPLVMYTFLGAIFSAIIASFVKKAEPVFDDETQE